MGLKAYVWLLATSALWVSCSENNQLKNTTAPAPSSIKPQPVATAKLLVPGRRVGHITLGITADSLTLVLGPPDSSDAAMGKAWLFWKHRNNKTRLDVYTTYSDSSMAHKTAQQICTNAPFFKTPQGVHVGSTLAAIKLQFPQVVKTATYTERGASVSVYDAVAAGIAFAVSDSVCTTIIIHPPGTRADAVYILQHPNMQPQ